jgi:D-glycero-D-manno-heptose 1,7-bisphosphate phosphatase
MRYDIPVLPMFTYREGGRHHIVVEPPILFRSTGNMEEDVQRHTQMYTEIIERQIRAHPDQWIWIHQRWGKEDPRPEPAAAVFLDRDGTLNEEVGYVSSLNRFRLLPGTAEAVAKINRAGLKAILITNQSGVGRGYFSEEFVRETHEYLQLLLSKEGARLDAVYVCTHHPDDRCSCRKPEPGLLMRAAGEHGVDLSRSFFIGDKLIDVETAHRAGARGVLVLTGYGTEDLKTLTGSDPVPPSRRPDQVAKNLNEAVEWVLEQSLLSERQILELTGE